ncbi:MAG: hypothetical protein AAF039_13900 [Bacteroidota bacterium]
MKKIFFLILGSSLLTWSCGSSDDDSSVTPEESEVQTLEGNYAGAWSSITPLNNYQGIPISAKITATSDPNVFRGEFFFTSNLISCCNSGANDGTLNITIDGDDVTEFVYRDVIPSCNGNFNGTGTTANNDTLTINFIGADCEGDHENGSLVLNKTN